MPVSPITIEALEILDAIERRGSFAKASEELNKATSALSYGVQKLEEQLGITVFERQGRKSVLTSAGRLLLEEGRKILSATRQLADQAKEVATGWEARLSIAIESTYDYSRFFSVLEVFLKNHANIEIDICESVLSGGWEALERDSVQLLVGAPGPVPLQKGFRAVILGESDMVPVIAAHHPLASLANNTEALKAALPDIRRIVIHDTSKYSVARSAGLSVGRNILYVQTMNQKIEAQLAGLGVGYLPRHRVQTYLDTGQLLELGIARNPAESYLAWKISSKGRALKALSSSLLEGSRL